MTSIPKCSYIRKTTVLNKISLLTCLSNYQKWILRLLGTYLVLVGIGLSNTLSAQCNSDDFSALRALYFAMNGDSWSDTTGWSIVRNNQTPPPSCDLSILNGITVDNNNRVSKIKLIEDRANGYIPSEIGDFLGLTHLTLTGKALNGPIPSEIGNLTNLESLNLHNNNLSGSIPSEIGNLSKLTFLNLGSNNLSSSIPM